MKMDEKPQRLTGVVDTVVNFTIKVKGKDEDKYNINVNGKQYSGWGKAKCAVGDFIDCFYVTRANGSKTYLNILEDNTFVVHVTPAPERDPKQSKLSVASAVETPKPALSAAKDLPPTKANINLKVDDITIGLAVKEAKRAIGLGATKTQILNDAIPLIEAVLVLKQQYGR